MKYKVNNAFNGENSIITVIIEHILWNDWKFYANTIQDITNDL
jgi:hypothetical protein